MQFKSLLPVFFIVAFLFTACSDENDNVQPSAPHDVNDVQTFVGNDMINFNYDECNFFTESQASYVTDGWSDIGGDWNTKILSTVLSDDESSVFVSPTLSFSLHFQRLKVEGEINPAAINHIMDTEVNTLRSPYFGFDIGVAYEGKFYSNMVDTSNEYDRYACTPDFKYEITEYDTEATNECLSMDAVSLRGNFEGTLYSYSSNEVIDSIYVRVPDFDLMVLYY